MNVFGPSPVARGGELRFLGSGLDKITAVIIPGCEEITDITVVSSNEIHVTVPQTAEPGYVTLKYANGEITTKTKLTYSEPISLESIDPLKVKAGDVLTINGEYLNLMHQVIFADEVIVPEENFIEHSRKVITVKVPAEAQTGKVIISDGAELPNMMYSDEELEVVLPAVESVLDLTGKKPGDVITVTGSDFDLIEKVVMPNGDEVKFTVEGNKLTFTLPENISDGAIVVVPASGVEVAIANIGVAVPSKLEATPNTDLRAGDVITIKGVNMELVASVTFPGVAEAVKPESSSATKITVTMPAAATSGDLLLNTNSGAQVPVAISTAKPSDLAYASETVALGNVVIIKGKNLDLVTEVTFTGGATAEPTSATATELSVQMPTSGVETGELTLKMANGETVSAPKLTIDAPEFCYMISIPTEEDEIKAGTVFSTEVGNPDKLTDVEIDGQRVQFIVNESTLIINVPKNAGKQSVVKLISSNGSVEYNIPFVPNDELETVVMGDMHDLGEWANEAAGGCFRIYKSDLANAGLAPGAKLRIYLAAYGDTQIQINDANWKQVAWYEDTKDNVPSMVEIDVDQALYDSFMNTADGWSDTGIIIQGKGCVISKVTVWVKVFTETAIWTGEWVCSGWNGNQDLAWGGYDWNSFKVGATIVFTLGFVDPSASWACIVPRVGDGWADLPDSGQIDLTPSASDQVVEWTPTANDINDLRTKNGLVLTGDGYILKKIAIK